MKKIFFLLLILSKGLYAQCPLGDEFVRSCTNGKWDKCPSDNYREGKRADGTYTCVCKNVPLSESHPSVKRMQADIKNLKASDTKQNIKINALQKSDANQDVEITNIKSDVNNLKGRMGVAEDEIKKRPEQTFKSPEPLAPKVEPKKDPPVKKEDPSLGPPREAPKVVVPAEPSFFVEPEIGVFWKSNNSPEFTSKSLWLASVGLRLRYQPQKWKGIFLFAKPSWVNIFGKNYLPETTPSPYPIQAVSQNGFLAEAGLGYRIWEYTEISIGYAQALSKGVEHESGAFADLEFGLEKVPVKLKIGAKYKHDFEFFGGVVARLPIKFKPKA